MPHDKKDNITHSTQANGKQCRCLRVFFVHLYECLCKTIVLSSADILLYLFSFLYVAMK